MRIFAAVCMAGCGMLAVSVFWISMRRSVEPPTELDRVDRTAAERRVETGESRTATSAASNRGASAPADGAEPWVDPVDSSRPRVGTASGAPPDAEVASMTEPKIDLAQWIDTSMLDGASAGDARALADLAEWIAEDASARWRVTVAAILARGDAESAIADLIALAESLAASDPEAPARLGGALEAILASSNGAPFPIGDDAARRAWIEALVEVSPSADSLGAGAFLAWSLSSAGSANVVAMDRLADLLRYSEFGAVRAHALQNLGKIASVQQIVDRVVIEIDAYPPEKDRLDEQQAYLVALLRAGGRDAAGRAEIVPYLETALHGWGATTEGSQALVHLLHHVALHPVPELRPTLERLADDDGTSNPVLRSLAERALSRLPAEDDR